MITQISLLKNIGQFDSVNPPSDLTFSPITLIYGENGQGKTTIAAILRSVSENNSKIVMERKRLSSQDSPHVIIDFEGNPTEFTNGTWSLSHPNILVFDDTFVSDNICSGIEVNSKQRQGLHEVILGSRGIALNNTLQNHIDRIEEYIIKIRELSNAIPASVRGPYKIDEFCNLEENKNIDSEIQNIERRHEAVSSTVEMRQRPIFQKIELPDFDIEKLNYILGRVFSDLETEAADRVQQHISKLGKGGEEWLSDGMNLVDKVSEDEEGEVCPYCAQDLSGSQIFEHYRSYFTQAYQDFKEEITKTGKAIHDTHGNDNSTIFERKINEAKQLHEYWKKFTELPQINIDTEAIVNLWKTVREEVLKQLREKFKTPLENMKLSPETVQTIQNYRARVDEVSKLSQNLEAANKQIDSVKQQAQADNLDELKNKLANLKSQKMRFDPSVILQCNALQKEKVAKADTEKLRDEARNALKNYQEQTFAKYEKLINSFLEGFLASFRLCEVNSKFSRAGASTSYKIVIDNCNVEIDSKSGPSFRNTLSSGDRNTLALAFFFASLELDSDLANKIVVFDDPMTSLDEYRKRQTCKKISSISESVKQVIVLSHSKSFLCYLWGYLDKNISTPLRVERAAVGTELVQWNVRNDSLTDHDLRHEQIRNYIREADHEKEREVAIDLRPTLEAFMRVAYPEHFPPGSMLGNFIKKCEKVVDGENEILSSDDIKELDELREYVNEFHHDTKPDCKKTVITDTELNSFAKRTLLFASRQKLIK